VCIFYADAARLDAADLPRTGAEEKDIADETLYGEVFIQRADDGGVGQAKLVTCVGDSAAVEPAQPVDKGAVSSVYAADGSLLGAIPAERNRQPIRLSRMSHWVPAATIAIEDRRFYSHGGLDPTGIAVSTDPGDEATPVLVGGPVLESLVAYTSPDAVLNAVRAARDSLARPVTLRPPLVTEDAPLAGARGQAVHDLRSAITQYRQTVRRDHADTAASARKFH
jgi:hypothetical protein